MMCKKEKAGWNGMCGSENSNNPTHEAKKSSLPQKPNEHQI